MSFNLAARAVTCFSGPGNLKRCQIESDYIIVIDYPPQAGEPSITFNPSGPIIVLRVNDLKGELPCGPLVINPDSVRASQFNLKIARQSSSVHLQVPAHPPLIIAGPFCQAEMTSTPQSIVSPLPIPILETLQRTPQPTPTEQHPPSPVLQAPRPHLTPA